MLRKILFPLLLGVAGCATLIWLGFWQVDRLAWKNDIIAGIEAQLAAAPRPLTLDVTEEADEYTPVIFTGTPTGAELHVLASGTAAGTGYRVISEVLTDVGPILLDQGLLPLSDKESAPIKDQMQITGTLLWPDDQNDNTPDPDIAKNVWFARNVVQMADRLDTEPLLVVATATNPADPRLTPLPVDTRNIKNDHLGYAITWFLLAITWAVMSIFLIYRTIRPKDA